MGDGAEQPADGLDRRQPRRDRAAAPAFPRRPGARCGGGFRAVLGANRAARPAAVRAGAILAAAAAALLVGALGRFRRAGTAVEPWRPSTVLVTDGVYRFTRNPIYLALALLYVGLALAVDSVVALCLLPPLLALVQVGVIAREERYLEGKFGHKYRRYLASVRRWL
jgi:protein-S-isoprenylcysteine O-methyltransferase Ste14